MSEHKVFKRVAVGLATVGLLAPLALSTITPLVEANASRRPRTHRVYRRHARRHYRRHAKRHARRIRRRRPRKHSKRKIERNNGKLIDWLEDNGEYTSSAYHIPRAGNPAHIYITSGSVNHHFNFIVAHDGDAEYLAYHQSPLAKQMRQYLHNHKKPKMPKRKIIRRSKWRPKEEESFDLKLYKSALRRAEKSGNRSQTRYYKAVIRALPDEY